VYDRFNLVEVTIDGEDRPAVSGALVCEGDDDRIYGWLDRFRADEPGSRYDMRAVTGSRHLIAARIECTAVSFLPARTEFEVIGEMEIAKLGQG